MIWSEINTIVSSLTDSDTTSFPTATRLIYANSAQADIAGTIIGADGRWQWDDTNYTSLPIGTTDVTSGTQDYEFDDSFLRIERVEIQDDNGDWHKLEPIDKADISVAVDEYQSTNGTPTHYDKIGDSVFLYPTPDFSVTDGLKVHFQRNSVDISSFGATSPGFYPAKHMILAYMISIPYCVTYKKDRVGLYEQKVREMREDIIDFYGQRSEDERTQITFKSIKHR